MILNKVQVLPFLTDVHRHQVDISNYQSGMLGKSQALMALYFSIWTLLTVLLPRLQVYMTVFYFLSHDFLHHLYAYTK